jgi:hypothetical protein
LVERLTIGLVGVTARQEEVVAAVAWCRAGALSWYSPQSSASASIRGVVVLPVVRFDGAPEFHGLLVGDGVISSGAALLGSGALGSSRQRRGSRPVPGRRRGGAPLPFSFPLLLFFLYFSSLCFSDLAAAQRGNPQGVAAQGGGGGLGGEAERPSYGAAADTAHGQFCPAAIHGVQAMAATWSASCGPPLGFGGAVQGQRGQFPPGRASVAGAGAPARLGVRAARGPARSAMRASVCTAGGGRKSHKHR